MDDATKKPGLATADISRVMKLLPHRYPFLLVDRMYDMDGDDSCIGVKNVTVNEPFFPGHFPQYPVMPGVLIIEALAQAAAILTFKSHGRQADDKSVYYFVGIDHARFKKPVVPGDTLELNAELKRFARGIWWFSAHARVADQVVTEAELMCTLRTIESDKI